MTDERKSGMQINGAAGCFLVAFVLIGSFGGMLYLVAQALEEIR